MHTWVSPKRSNGLLGLRLRVQLPCFIRLLVRGSAALESHLILADDGLAIKDEEGDDAMGIPLVEVLPDMNLNASQAAKSRKQRLVRGIGVQKETQKVGGIDGNGAVFEFGNLVGAVG